MNTQHTPGPWRVTRNVVDQYNVELSDGELRSVIARCWDSTLCPEHKGNVEANARLIAAAPELLSALQALLAYVSLLTWTGPVILTANPNMNQHTSGQWEQRAERFGRQTTHCIKIGNTLCHLTRGVGMTEHEMEANARLIAAAPLLLNALQALLAYADEYSDAMKTIGRGAGQLGADADSVSVAAQARAAISKATNL